MDCYDAEQALLDAPWTEGSDDEGWFDDVPGNLDTFVRLSKAGLYAKADLFYRDLLRRYAADDFAVAAQYAEILIEQGAYKAAEKFLDGDAVFKKRFGVEEQTIFQLLYANARMYTHLEWDQAAKLAAKAVHMVGEVFIEEAMSPTKLQIQIISLRIISVILENTQTDEGLILVMQFNAHAGSDKDSGWKDIIMSLLLANHVWEAHTLLKIYLRYERCWDEAELRQILEAVPRNPDTMYRLVRMSILLECLRYVGHPSDGHDSWRQELREALKEGHIMMDGTQHPIEESSAYEALQLFDAERSGSKGITSPCHTLHSAMESGNFMFALSISRQYSIPLPGNWFAQTGADKRSVTLWHPMVRTTQSSFLTGRVLLDVVSHPAVSEWPHDATRAMRISITHSRMKKLLRDGFRIFEQTMQMPILVLKEVSSAIHTLNTLLGLPGEVSKRAINAAMSATGNDGILEIASKVFRRATQKAVLNTLVMILRTTLSALIGYLGPVGSIWKTVIDDPANQELFDTLNKDWWKVARFFVDLLEPMKLFVSAGSIDGTPPPGAVSWNYYNELDLSQAMNRHAVFSQIQRFFRSVIEVFRQKDLDASRFEMNTRLESDSTESTMTITALKRKDDKVKTAETWLFVNGVAGEFHWNHLAVSKIQDYFFDRDDPEDNSDDDNARRTMIKSVFNRSDGIFWDLIESAGERRPEASIAKRFFNTPLKAPLSSRTASSREAQAALLQALRSALSDSKTSRKDIIMIAHSQGCLLLRIALEEILANKEGDLEGAMRAHLHIFTFGNPAYDWDVHADTASTEHFANELDYVAKLGVLRQFSTDPNEGMDNDSTYCSRCKAGDEKHLQMPKQLIFVNNKRQSGHLFGSQYSLQARDYDCVNGMSMSALLSRSELRS